ncbi:glucose 1-dehydrogenase [Pseudomonas sp. MPC6]|uniref:SDR family NAD(P)-dependent oxidoreductase n=1 Tax=unclassified Pseudomonas TaxID=196821 RepID=UPI0011107A20|nr:glucose 1-dehydrogenase [Pseudomonas sp. MPC6]QCY09509.1 glucose 1-dehydrogenase [Pseudomonas sp. MPC6]
MTGRLVGKIAIVTGGGRGIGRAIVERFVVEGAQVVVAGRSEPDPPFAGGAGNPLFCRTDVARAADVQALMAFALERFGRLDVLVNNASVQLEKPIGETSEAEWDWLMGINLKGVFLCAKAALAPMRQAGGGVILNIGSYDGFAADPGLAAYCASKGGVHALSKSIAVDYGREGIRCNAICPGWIRTDMMSAYLQSQADPAEAEGAVIAQHPVGRLGEPQDIANLATWLASDEASFASGQLFVLDGGLTAHAPYVQSRN